MKSVYKISKKMYVYLLIILMIFMLLDMILFPMHFLYKINYNIDISEPNNIENIISIGSLQDGLYLDRFSYSSQKIQKLIKKRCFKKINAENKRILISKYNSFLNGIDEKNKEIFKANINQDIFNEDNYFVLFETGDSNSMNYNLALLILNLSNKEIYSIRFIA